jgi:TatD DNase family protein
MQPNSIFFDTHAHLDEPSLFDQLDAVIERATTSGVVGVIAIGTTVESSRRCAAIALKYDNVWAAVGIQPNYCGEAAPEDWAQIVQLARAPKVVALGETGLDRYWDHAPWPIQVDYFRRHIELSRKTGLPLVIHMRDCEGEMLDELEHTASGQTLPGIMHSFTGSSDGAHQFLRHGLHVSFAGMVTYPKSEALRAVAAQIPADRLLLETDSPYLSPHPKRGQRPNEPALIVHTAHCLAGVRNVSPGELAELTTANARRLFSLD